jgi:hypothetical protein
MSDTTPFSPRFVTIFFNCLLVRLHKAALLVPGRKEIWIGDNIKVVVYW